MQMHLHRNKRHSQYQHSKHAQPCLICSSNHTTQITIFIEVHWIENYKYIQQKPKSSYDKNVVYGSMPEKRRVITLGDKILNIR